MSESRAEAREVLYRGMVSHSLGSYKVAHNPYPQVHCSGFQPIQPAVTNPRGVGV